MDQHPIPQDVTGFQFKLVGAMTVKQFGYVASGVVMAVILYYLPLKTPLSLLIKLFLIPLFGVGGVIIAFVPIDGRPIDVMASNFIKALFSPNQYIYKRQGRTFSFTQIASPKTTQAKPQKESPIQTHKTSQVAQSDDKEAQLRALLQGTRSEFKSDLDKKEAAFLNTLSLPNATPVVPPIAQIPLSQPNSITTKPQVEPFQPIAPLNLNDMNKQSVPPNAPDLIAKPQSPFQADMPKTPELKPTVPVPAQDPIHVRTIPQDITKKAGLAHVSDTPNVIVGIVKDPRGNVIPNILVEVKDQSGNPVRAFKTNALGQFASATPLTTGTYTMDLEDPKKMHRFDVIQITADNQIMLPIEVISHDAREDLRQQLFAN